MKSNKPQKSIKHKYYGSPTYRSWQHMKAKCVDSEPPVPYDERWLDFENFLEDMGERPADTTLERIEESTGYFKSNCRWAIILQRQKKYFTYKGKSKTLAEWAKVYKLPRYNLYNRICMLHWPIEKALTTPVRDCSKVWHNEE